MRLTLKIWRQAGPQDKGGFETYTVDEISEDMSFLEMLDELNENLQAGGIEPVLHKEDLVYEFIEMKQRSYK